MTQATLRNNRRYLFIIIVIIIIITGFVRGCSRLLGDYRLRVWHIFQLSQHNCPRPQGDEGQPDQPDPVLDRRGGHPADAGVHPLYRAHVHPHAECDQGPGGEGEDTVVEVYHCEVFAFFRCQS